MSEKNWWDLSGIDWARYIRSYGEGVGFPSRNWFANHMKNNPGWSVLDVGAGGGIEYESLIAYIPDLKYKGVDYAETAIEYCKKAFPETEWAVEDARRLDGIAADSFDVVLLRHSLDHIDDWEAALRAAWRVARKEVVVILWPTTFDNVREHTLQSHGHDGWFRMYSRPALINWCTLNLNSESVNVTLIPATGVPGREYRTDTCFVIKKKQ